ncbi:MAG: autotransporter outer membrane beta-barrel domain-containing protein [Pseudobdellovibrionaceae bacterium]|nr:autotransporter outer membrane beta-barrel domain-containing protein [Pseudobdellovibrionaceae bacterium]
MRSFFSSPSSPHDIEPAAGPSSPAPLITGKSVYLIGSVGVGQDQDFDNHDLNGTLGVSFQFTNNFSVGVGVIGSSGTTTLSDDGKSTLNAKGGSIISAYEGNNGLRLYGTAFATRITIDSDRHYRNGSGFDSSNGQTSGLGLGAAARVGWELPMHEDISITPYSEIQIVRASLDSYTEKGGAFAATVNNQSLNNITTHLGTQVNYQLSPDITFSGSASWGRRLSGNADGLSVSTSGFSGVIDYDKSDKNWAEAAPSTAWSISPQTSLSAEILGRSGHVKAPSASATIGIRTSF